MTPEDLIRSSGVIDRLRQKAFDIRLRKVCRSKDFEIVHCTFRRYPVVELTLYLGNEETPLALLQLRSRVWRLFNTVGFHIRQKKLFVCFRRSVARIVCVPAWDGINQE